jgi:hypothetical protein
MNLNRSRRNHTSELLCAQLESYVSWRAQSRDVAESYRAWIGADTHERTVAFARYNAALDREELAALDYRRTLDLVGEPSR